MTLKELLDVLDSDEISIYNADRTAMYERGAALDHKVIKVEPYVVDEIDYDMEENPYVYDSMVCFDILID